MYLKYFKKRKDERKKRKENTNKIKNVRILNEKEFPGKLVGGVYDNQLFTQEI